MKRVYMGNKLTIILLITVMFCAAVLPVGCAKKATEHSLTLEAEYAIVSGEAKSGTSFVGEENGANAGSVSNGRYLTNLAVVGNTVSWVFSATGGSGRLYLSLVSGGSGSFSAAAAFSFSFNGALVTVPDVSVSSDRGNWSKIDLGAVTYKDGFNIAELKVMSSDCDFDLDYLAVMGDKAESHNHAWSREAVSPTCDSDGYVTRTCNTCEISYDSERAAALGHDYSDYFYSAEEIGGKIGAMVSECSRCGNKRYASGSLFGEAYSATSQFTVRRYSTAYEAEDAVVSVIGGLSGGADSYVVANSKASGGKYVGNLSKPGNSVSFTVKASEACTADLVVTLANTRTVGESIGALNSFGKYVKMTVGGTAVNADYAVLPGSEVCDYTIWRYLLVRNVPLGVGENTLTLLSAENDGDVSMPNIDVLKIYTDKEALIAIKKTRELTGTVNDSFAPDKQEVVLSKTAGKNEYVYGSEEAEAVDVVIDVKSASNLSSLDFALELSVFGKNVSLENLAVVAGRSHKIVIENVQAAVGSLSVTYTGNSLIRVSGVTVYKKRSIVIPVTYTVTFNTNGGNDIQNQIVEEGGDIDLSTPERDGYTFNGWFDNAGLSGEVVTSPFVPTADVTLFAAWSEDATDEPIEPDKPVLFTVVFNVNGGSAVQSQQIEKGSSITLPITTKDGYTFDGWFGNAAFTGSALASPFTPVENTTLYAKWTSSSSDVPPVDPDPVVTYEVIFYTNGGNEVQSMQVEEGNGVALPTPVRDGYTFVGWFSNASLTGDAVSMAYTPTASVNLYAKWDKNIVYYTVAFNANGGNAIQSQTIEQGGSAVLPTPVRDGYTFGGWFNNPSLAGAAVSSPFTPERSSTLYAKWTKNIVYYTVAFDTKGGNTIQNKTTEEGGSIELPTPVRDGYNFGGWFSSESLTGEAVSTPFTPESSLTLYAKWNKIIVYYTVTFNTNGGDSIQSKTVQEGSSVELPAPVKNGYTFEGWFDNAAFTGDALPSSYTPASSLTLYANWTKTPIDPAPGHSESDFLHADGKVLKNAKGEVVTLKGINAGGYLVIEQWMCAFDSEIYYDHKMVTDTFTSRFGAEKTLELWEIYRNSFWKEEDFKKIADIGFNVIRLPFTYMNVDPAYNNIPAIAGQTFNFTVLDEFVSMASKYGLYTILDLHGAYGSQNGQDHSGEAFEKVEDVDFYSNAEKKAKTTALWKALSEHYKANPAVAGYDILNEPGEKANWTNAKHWAYFDELYDTIRNNGDNHVVIFESCWDPAQLPLPSTYGWNNCMYSFHHYSGTEDATHLDTVRDKYTKFVASGYDVPVFMGEFSCYNSQSNWRETLALFNEWGWSWTSWTYKLNRKEQYSYGGWAPYYTHAANVNPATDSFESIKTKFSKLGTTDANSETHYFDWGTSSQKTLADVFKDACA